MISFLDLYVVNRPYEKDIQKAVGEVLQSGWYIRGSHVTAFEHEYADYIGTNYCVGVANGLEALTLIYRAYIEMGIMKPGDEVIVPANTYIASILAVIECGLVPVMVEPDPFTLQIDGTKVELAITSKTRSVMIVHLYGRCAYTSEIADICQRYNLKLVEDNAQAHGCIFGGKKTGSLGDAAGHSFYPTKNLGALGDAGAVTTNDTLLADMIRSMANYGSDSKNVFRYKGMNSRLDEIQAAILSIKLKSLDNANTHRREIARFYLENIRNRVVDIPSPMIDEANVWHQFPVLCENRDLLADFLAKNGIETQIHYPIPPHQQSCLSEYAYLSLPVTEHIHRCELSLPISSALSLSDASTIVETINSFKP